MSFGIYTDPLVKQLSGRCKRYLCGACGGICGIVLQRYHARKIFAGFVTEKLGDHKMIRLGTTILLAGCAAVLLPIPSDTAALAGLVVMGIGCAPVYPSIIHATPANFGEKNSQQSSVSRWRVLMSALHFMPPVFGLIVKSYFHHTAAGLCADFHCVNVFSWWKRHSGWCGNREENKK